MAFLRKAGNMLGKTLGSRVTQEVTSCRPSIFQAIRCMSSSKLFIGGLSYGTDDTSLTEAFSKYGEVAEARVIVDRDTGRSKGFGFVTYTSVDDASAAIQALDQQELHGRRIRVDYATDRARGSGGGGYQGGGYNNNDGYGGTYGGGNYVRGGGGYGGSGGGVDKYDGGNMSYGSDGQNFGVAGGAGGSSGAGTQFASSGQQGFGDTFGTEQSNQFGDDDKGFRQDDPLDGNYRDDDDTPGNYADRRG